MAGLRIAPMVFRVLLADIHLCRCGQMVKPRQVYRERILNEWQKKMILARAELVVLTALTIVLTSCSRDPDPMGGSDTYFPRQARIVAGSWEIVMTDSLTQERDTLWVTLKEPGDRRGKPTRSIASDLVVSCLLRNVGGPCEEDYWRASGNFIDRHHLILKIEDGEGKWADWRYQGEFFWQSDTLWVGTYSYNFDDTSRPQTRFKNWALPGNWRARKVAVFDYTLGDLPKCPSP